MRVMRVMAACIVAAVALSGCVRGNGIKVDGLNQGMGGRFEYDTFTTDTDSTSFGKVVDTETGVTYLVVRCYYGKRSWGGITPLLNRDGSPVIDGRYE